MTELSSPPSVTAARRPSRRAHYRIQYPNAARPKLLIEGHTFEVLDISEGGLRYQSGPYPTPNIGTSFRGTVRVRRGELIHTHGNVVRAINGEVAARLVVGIPFQTIMEEQRYVFEQFAGVDA
jgi:hypothetical protein